MAVPNSEMISTGLRPIRSDSRPHTGANTNWASEYDATSRPVTVAVAPNRWAYCGRIGSTIPKPIRSMATVVQIVPKPVGNGWRSRPARPRSAGGRGSGHAASERDRRAEVKSSRRPSETGHESRTRREVPGLRSAGQAGRIWVPAGVSSTT